MMGDDRAVRPHRLRQQPGGVPVRRRLLDDLVEGADEVELAVVADPGEGGGDPPPVEHAQQVHHRERLRLAVQLPRPRTVLGRVQPLGEVQQPPLQQPPVVDTGPDGHIVHRGRPVRGQDRLPGVQHLAPQPDRHPAQRPGAAGDLHLVSTDEVAAQPLGRRHQTRQMTRRQPVTGVEEGHVLAARHVQPGVARGGDPAVGAPGEKTHPGDVREVLGGTLEKGQGSVLGMVVDQNELEIRAGVRAQTSERVRGVLPHIVERDDQRKLRHAQDIRSIARIGNFPMVVRGVNSVCWYGVSGLRRAFSRAGSARGGLLLTFR